ncbi:hypothetical protein AB0F15_37315 [Amycolatopsis sp. NPDC026612]|uniref:hypothetical protein n=1 Tax=Amycolatopsis sp. NPDC026612 TaxID=3155466 RepID=UPI0033D4B85B
MATARKIDEVSAGKVVSLLLPAVSSLIVRKNNGVAHCFSLRGLAGLFRKDAPDTLEFGRRHCDLIKKEFDCEGFFTTDELPRYGLDLDDGNYLHLHSGADPDTDVTVVTLYTRSMAIRIRDRLTQELSNLLRESHERR